MIDLSTAIEQMGILFLVACVGFGAAKLGYLDNHTKERLNKLLMNVTLPCMVVASAEGVFVLMMATPVGTLVPMWAEQFGRDPVLAAKGTIISTALSFALITFMATV